MDTWCKIWESEPAVNLQNASLTLQQRIEALHQGLHQANESISDKKASLASLNVRKQGVATGVSDGAKRSLQASNSLRNAQAHQALRASLLCEKQELITHLQEELGQVTMPAPFSCFWKQSRLSRRALKSGLSLA